MSTTVNVGLSPAFKNKTLLPGQPNEAFGNSFIPSKIVLSGLSQHIDDGKAWTPGYFNAKKRHKDNFVSSQILALDLDDNTSIVDCQQNEDVKRYAWKIHPSPSSTKDHAKTRAIFILDSPITSADKWEQMSKATIHHFSQLKPDTGCKDAARLYFGSTVPGGIVDHNKRLPLSVALQWIAEYDAHVTKQLEETRKDAPGKVTVTGSRAESYINKALENIASELSSVGQGERNKQLFKSACRLFGFVKGGAPITESVVRAELTTSAKQNDLPDHEIKRTLDSAWQRAESKTLELEDTQPSPSEHWNDVNFASASNEVTMPPRPNGNGSELTQLSRSVNNLARIAQQKSEIEQQQTVIFKLEQQLEVLKAKSANIEIVDTPIDASWRNFQNRAAKPRAITGLKSGLQQLDYAIGGWNKSAAHMILGVTGSGKSQFVASIARSFIEQSPGIIISYESGTSQFIERLVAVQARVPYGAIPKGGRIQKDNEGKLGFTPFNGEEKDRIRSSYQTLQELRKDGRFIFPKKYPYSPEMLFKFIEYWKEKRGLEWAIIDSLNDHEHPGMNATELTLWGAKTAEKIAVELEMTVAATAQGGRNTKDRSDKRLTIYDAQHSSGVEQKAFVHLSLYNHWLHVWRNEIDHKSEDEKEYPQGTVKAFINKSRGGGLEGFSDTLRYIGGSGFYSATKCKRCDTYFALFEASNIDGLCKKCGNNSGFYNYDK